ncbi:MAG TPA: phenylalanine--tRNA ligase subunit beta [Acidimicrobiales bacterium]|nr:phenylalanine--tRNA ligase subunit beta [Acidimicrobiales bacterium]
MKAPLSWLRDFAPFDTSDPSAMVTTLDELGLVVEGVEHVGEGLGDVVVALVESIDAIPNADRIRLVTVDAGEGPVEVVCGAWNFSPGDLVPLAPVGAVLPGDFEIQRRKMKGATSNGMLCSAAELRLSDDHEGILVLNDVEGARPGLALVEALGIEPDVVFDITVEGNRPDAWSMAGIARDLAGRLRLPFTLPSPAPAPDLGTRVEELATLEISDPDLCPRMVVRVLEGVRVAPSPRWLARRLLLAGMRPINNVVDASNYVMLELGQPTHPYDLDRLAGAGLIVRRARPKETVVTLDGVERVLGTPGRGLGDTGEDCLICDAEGAPVGVGGIMGGASSEISDTTTRVLLEAAYFTPMAIARTSKRLGLRTEASARFERGCDPWGIDRSVDRFCELVGAPTATGKLDVRGAVPEPQRIVVPAARVRAVLGVDIVAEEAASLIEPIGFGAEPAPTGAGLLVTVPTNRPDVRPAPHGVDDVIEEIARTYGYSRIPRHQPSWPEPGGLTPYQRERRLAADALTGVGALEAWTPSLVDDADHVTMGLTGRAVEVSNPIAKEEAWLRRSMLPGLVRALVWNANRRQGAVRLFEIGTVFSHPDEAARTARGGAAGSQEAVLPGECELLCAVFAAEGDDARMALAAWRVLADALRLLPVDVVADGSVPGVHPTRAARLIADGGEVLGVVAEVDPAVSAAFGYEDGRIGWLEVDLGRLFDRVITPRRSDEARTFSRFPSSDVDVALVVPDDVPASRVEAALVGAGSDLLEAASLFDVYRGPGVPEGHRSLAYRLRFSSTERTLTDEEVGGLRQRCIDAATAATGAVLR